MSLATIRRADTARRTAEAAAGRSQVEIRELHGIEEMTEVRRLFDRVWQTGANGTPVTADMLRAIAQAGNYVSGAYDGETLVGACFGFFGPPAHRLLHSHITGVSGRAGGRHVGFALKLHQRAWALQRGIEEITWTFDPLIRRNAYFNLAKLSAEATEYLPNFYGPMDDDINRGDDTDRVLIRWRLSSAGAEAASAGDARPVSAATARMHGARVALGISAAERPIPAPDGPDPEEGRTLLIAIPPDIEAMRLRDPGLAAEWRRVLRESLLGPLEAGARVRGFDRSGWYIVERQE